MPGLNRQSGHPNPRCQSAVFKANKHISTENASDQTSVDRLYASTEYADSSICNDEGKSIYRIHSPKKFILSITVHLYLLRGVSGLQ
jgi:hypothetical protein